MQSTLRNPKWIRLRLILLLILIPAFFAGLFFATKVSPIVTEGTIDLSGTTDETVYLFGEWRICDTYAAPDSGLFDSAPNYAINTNSLPNSLADKYKSGGSSNDLQQYSLQAAINNFDTANRCLLLYNINYVGRIYIGGTLVYDADDTSGVSQETIALDGLSLGDSFTITLWMTGGAGGQGILSPLTLLLTHTDNAYFLSVVRIVFKYLLEGIYFAFALVCLMMYIKNKSAVHFLLLSLSGLIRLLVLESYLAPHLMTDLMGLSASWSLRLSMTFIAVANTINLGVIYILYKPYVFKKTAFSMLAVVNVFLLLSLIFGSGTFTLLLNCAGYTLYLVCLLAVGRAWFSNEKSAGIMFAAFWFYLISLTFFYATRMLAGLGSTLGVYNFICPIGEFIFYTITIFAFFVRYIESYVQNISQIQTLDSQLFDKERSLGEAYDKLRRFEAARTTMLRDLAHDLRTPVTSVLGYLSMMAAGEITDEQDVQSIAGKMLLRVRQIKDMTNSISGLMTLEQGELKMQFKACPVSYIMDAVMAHYEHKCENSGLYFALCRHSHASVLVDMPQIMRVFDNLIDNALRYTPNGGTITVSADDTDGMVRFSVRDTGCGIPEDQRPHVFGRFYRSETSRSESSAHQGLGLAICYEIVKAHHGSIGVTSKYGKGSEFYFSLKRAAEGETYDG